MKFEDSPLLTPGLVRHDTESIFAVLPDWVVAWSFPDEAVNDATEIQTRTVVWAAGKTHCATGVSTVLQYALLAESTRLGGGLATNSNHASKSPRFYHKMTFVDGGRTLVVRRIFAAAGANEAVTYDHIRCDYRPSNLKLIGAGRPQKDAISFLVKEVQKLAEQRQRNGTMPRGLAKDTYLENFHALLQAVAEEREAALR